MPDGPHSEATARALGHAVRRLADGAFDKAILTERRDLLHEGAALLIALEMLTETELAPIAGRTLAGVTAVDSGRALYANVPYGSP